jgi:hypothetical protein
MNHYSAGCGAPGVTVSPATVLAFIPNEPNPISLGFQGILLANENLKIVKFKKLVNR